MTMNYFKTAKMNRPEISSAGMGFEMKFEIKG